MDGSKREKQIGDDSDQQSGKLTQQQELPRARRS